MDDKFVPIKVMDKELPIDNIKQYKEIIDDDINKGKSNGFADFIFLGAIMVVCFMWGMLTILLM